ncbi:MAG: hypothetical protein ACI81R_001680 [Bradymonadia bacterium]|jgi:hypothetical protein
MYPTNDSDATASEKAVAPRAIERSIRSNTAAFKSATACEDVHFDREGSINSTRWCAHRKVEAVRAWVRDRVLELDLLRFAVTREAAWCRRCFAGQDGGDVRRHKDGIYYVTSIPDARLQSAAFDA